MYRTVFTPTETDNMIPFCVPREWYGRNVEIIAFPIDLPRSMFQETEKKSVRKFKAMPARYSFSTKDFKFSRDEANDYE